MTDNFTITTDFPSGMIDLPLPDGGTGMLPPGAPPVDPGKTSEVVAGGWALASTNAPHALTHYFDDLVAQFGPALYEVMDLDPVLRGARQTLDEAVLADRLHASSAIDEEEEAEGEPRTDADLALAEEVAEEAEAMLQGLDPPIHEVLRQLLDARRDGNRLAEKVYAPEGDTLTLRSLKIKPRWSYYYVADAFLNVRYILAFVPAEPGSDAPGGWRLLPPEKFVVATWDSPHGDPRGSSCYRTAYDAWNLKVQSLPDYYKFLKFYAGFRLAGELPENVRGQFADPATGKPISAEQQFLTNLISFANGQFSAIVHGHGGKVYTVEPQGDGSAYRSGFDLLDRWMVRSQLHTTSATMEAEHYSKGGGEVGQDTVGTRVRFVRAWLCGVVREQVVRPWLALRRGDDVARRLCPRVTLGSVEHQDFSRMANSIANLARSGYLEGTDVRPLDRWLGLPIRRATGVLTAAQPGLGGAQPPADPQPPPG